MLELEVTVGLFIIPFVFFSFFLFIKLRTLTTKEAGTIQNVLNKKKTGIIKFHHISKEKNDYQISMVFKAALLHKSRIVANECFKQAKRGL